jgi:hypothetical protein
VELVGGGEDRQRVIGVALQGVLLTLRKGEPAVATAPEELADDGGDGQRVIEVVVQDVHLNRRMDAQAIAVALQGALLIWQKDSQMVAAGSLPCMVLTWRMVKDKVAWEGRAMTRAGMPRVRSEMQVARPALVLGLMPLALALRLIHASRRGFADGRELQAQHNRAGGSWMTPTLTATLPHILWGEALHLQGALGHDQLLWVVRIWVKQLVWHALQLFS